MAEFSIVIVSVKPESKADVRAALGKALGIPPDTATPVLDAVPTVLFGSLDFHQGRRLMEVLGPVARAGAVILLTEGKGGGLKALTWPAEPVIAGKPISAYSSPREGLHCPACGAPLESSVRLLEQATPIHGGPLLPDVPQLAQADSDANPVPKVHRKGTSVVLDITDVEKVWQERAAASNKRDQAAPNSKKIAGAPPQPSSSALMQALDDAPPLAQGDATHYDVVASGSANPNLSKIVARARGISLKQASELAQKRIVHVAKGVDQKTAKKLVEKLKEFSISARIMPGQSPKKLPRTSSRRKRKMPG